MCAVSCVCAFDVSVEVVLGGVSWGGACYKVLRGIARCIPAISKKGGEAGCSLRSAQRLSGDGRTRGPAEAPPKPWQFGAPRSLIKHGGPRRERRGASSGGHAH